MFHGMWNSAISGTNALPDTPPSESQLLKWLYDGVRARMPDAWRVELSTETLRTGKRVDAVLRLEAPDGTQADVIVEVKRSIEPIDVAALVSQLHSYANSGEGMLVAAPFIAPRTRALLAASRVGYADATGNLRVQLDRPAVFIEANGTATNPWPDNRPLRSLKGPAAGRVVRALCDFRPPYGIRQLAERSKTPAGSVSRVVALLEREALLTRGRNGEVEAVDWPQLIRRWTQDYSLAKSNETRTFLELRGLDALVRKLPQMPVPYSVTGSLAAALVAPIAPSRLAVVYVQDIELAADKLSLRPAERGANVLLARPFDHVVFDRTLVSDSVVYVAWPQVAADLLTSPGRGPQEGEALLRWMGEHEDAWRA
jgi:hypothetical protein